MIDNLDFAKSILELYLQQIDLLLEYPIDEIGGMDKFNKYTLLCETCSIVNINNVPLEESGWFSKIKRCGSCFSILNVKLFYYFDNIKNMINEYENKTDILKILRIFILSIIKHDILIFYFPKKKLAM